MNDDLISRKALLEDIENSMMQNPHQDIKVRQIHNHEHRHFFCMVTQEPTAFDKEKVINTLMIMATISEERMKFYAEKGFTQNESLADGKARAYRSAIEIVEKGGIE